jgi:DNA-binding transcriptional MerR regulator
LEKAPDAFRTISEVADEIDVPQHVLRFWESRFPQIRPMKRGGGRRYYRPDDVDLLRGVRHLLYGEGYTIRGVQRILREHGVTFVQTVWSASADLPDFDDDEEEVGDEIAAEDDQDEEAATAGRSEPNLFAVGTPRAQERDAPPDVEPRVEPRVTAGIRREPTILPPISLELDAPSPPVQPSAAPPAAVARPAAPSEADDTDEEEDEAPAALAAEERQKLKAALDELIACRRIIETALAQS